MSEFDKMAKNVFRIEKLISEKMISHVKAAYPDDIENQIFLVKHIICALAGAFSSMSLEDSELDKFYTLMRRSHEIARAQIARKMKEDEDAGN